MSLSLFAHPLAPIFLTLSPPPLMHSEERTRHGSKRGIQSRQDALLNYYTEKKETAANFVFCCAILLLLSSFQQPDLEPHISERLLTLAYEYFKKSTPS